jgi:hypothetical protein
MTIWFFKYLIDISSQGITSSQPNDTTGSTISSNMSTVQSFSIVSVIFLFFVGISLRFFKKILRLR